MKSFVYCVKIVWVPICTQCKFVSLLCKQVSMALWLYPAQWKLGRSATSKAFPRNYYLKYPLLFFSLLKPQKKLGNYVLKMTDPENRIIPDPWISTWKISDPPGQSTLYCYEWERTIYFVMPLKFGGLSVAVVSTTLNRSSQSASIVEVKKKKKMTTKKRNLSLWKWGKVINYASKAAKVWA